MKPFPNSSGSEGVNIMERFFERYKKTVSPLTKSPPKKLFHYTSLVGLTGIIQTGELRGTHIRHFEDKAEFYIGFNRSISLLSERKKATRSEEEQQYPQQLTPSTQQQPPP